MLYSISYAIILCVYRWEKYLTDEEIALGRGKRQRKAVSYKKAQGPKSMDTSEHRCLHVPENVDPAITLLEEINNSEYYLLKAFPHQTLIVKTPYSQTKGVSRIYQDLLGAPHIYSTISQCLMFHSRARIYDDNIVNRILAR
ncbi:chromatin remodeling 4 [Artemisia annua]|uniref:Chromatin remodeling 4 n=1 Tax=Artemisia annua TaxID=35608 RepID=A0A2U1KYV7_ARTAN|nr:chromatin remodeling 4 [Artemisia annua]